MKKSFTPSLFSVLCLLLIFNACRKTDLLPAEIKNPVEEKFFTVPTAAAPDVQAILQSIFRQNQTHDFINALVKERVLLNGIRQRLLNRKMLTRVPDHPLIQMGT